MKASFSGLDPEKCAQRNRIAARRDGVDAASVQLLQGAPSPAADPRVITAKGVLPKDDDEAIQVINSVRSGGDPLTKDQVHIHYLEAASSRYIGDRYMFLDGKTLRNIASGASDGFAFMNSHRTGDISTPSELPFGRTFAGRYEHFIDADGEQRQRSLLGVYMLRGVRPNGENGPSTDDLSAAIKAGTVFDVSMGLYGGKRVCDVCGNELNSRDPETNEYLCPHAPGTHRHMDAEARDAQKKRGVPGGHATYSLVDATPGEVSAVYDGAVPGAGFRKAIGLSRQNKLSGPEIAEARHAYSALLSKGDLSITNADRPGRRPREKTAMGMKLLDAFRFWKAAGEPEEIDLETFAIETPRPTQDDCELTKEVARLKAENAANAKLAADNKAAADKANEGRINDRAESFVASIIMTKDAVATPGERAAIKADFVLAARDDLANPVAGSPDFRQDALKRAYKARKPHGLLGERGSSDPADESRALGSDPALEHSDPVKKKAEDDARAARKEANRKYAESLNPAVANN